MDKTAVGFGVMDMNLRILDEHPRHFYKVCPQCGHVEMAAHNLPAGHHCGNCGASLDGVIVHEGDPDDMSSFSPTPSDVETLEMAANYDVYVNDQWVTRTTRDKLAGEIPVKLEPLQIVRPTRFGDTIFEDTYEGYDEAGNIYSVVRVALGKFFCSCGLDFKTLDTLHAHRQETGHPPVLNKWVGDRYKRSAIDKRAQPECPHGFVPKYDPCPWGCRWVELGGIGYIDIAANVKIAVGFEYKDTGLEIIPSMVGGKFFVFDRAKRRVLFEAGSEKTCATWIEHRDERVKILRPMAKTRQCSSCGGTGDHRACKGEGCEKCGGSGTCPNCGGDGRIEVRGEKTASHYYAHDIWEAEPGKWYFATYKWDRNLADPYEPDAAWDTSEVDFWGGPFNSGEATMDAMSREMGNPGFSGETPHGSPEAEALTKKLHNSKNKHKIAKTAAGEYTVEVYDMGKLVDRQTLNTEAQQFRIAREWYESDPKLEILLSETYTKGKRRWPLPDSWVRGVAKKAESWDPSGYPGKYCRACGAPLHGLDHCPQCGSEELEESDELRYDRDTGELLGVPENPGFGFAHKGDTKKCPKCGAIKGGASWQQDTLPLHYMRECKNKHWGPSQPKKKEPRQWPGFDEKAHKEAMRCPGTPDGKHDFVDGACSHCGKLLSNANKQAGVCPRCKGDGWVLDILGSDKPCPKCRGTGEVKEAAMSEEKVRQWLLNYAWLGTEEEQQREVECIMAQGEWKYLEAQIEHYRGMGSGEEEDLDSEATSFALSALYEAHDEPHLPICPRNKESAE